MRILLSRLIIGLGLGLGLSTMPAHGQAIAPRQVDALVEALRRAAPQPLRSDDELYSAWQVKGDNIARWARFCQQPAITPAEFDRSAEKARTIVSCIVKDALEDEYEASGNDEAIAVRRVAAWWMTGDPTQYAQGDTATYTQQVLRFYQGAGPSQNAARPATPAARPATPTARPPQAAAPAAQGRTLYDRYMQAGYKATQERDYDTAAVYFKRALDERPRDSYATSALQNVEKYQSQPPEAASEESNEENGSAPSLLDGALDSESSEPAAEPTEPTEPAEESSSSAAPAEGSSTSDRTFVVPTQGDRETP